MITYLEIMREVAVRVNAVTGNTTAAKYASLTTSPLTTAQIGSVEFPFTTVQWAILSAVARVIRTYANVKNHPLRLYNLTQTASITSGSQIPFVNSDNVRIVGAYGAVMSDGQVLTEQPKQIIDSIIRSADSLKKTYYYYIIEDGRIFHTCPDVTIDVVAFDMDVERTKQSTNLEAPIPDSCFDIVWMAALGLMFTDESYQNQATLCNNYVNSELAKMINGAVSFDPAPSFAVTANGAN